MRIHESKHPVANWIWQDGHFRPELGRSEPVAAEDLASLSGQFAIHEETGPGDHLLVRDRLGINKLFFAIDERGEVHSSNFLYELRCAGFALDAIHSVPSGHSIRVSPARGEYRLDVHSSLQFAKAEWDPATALRHHAEEIRGALEATFAQLSVALRGRRVFVTLSGGLDSATIAALAARSLPDVTAVTFELGDDEAAAPPSDDLASACKIARALGIEHEIVRISPTRLLELLDPVLIWGQDWRDFNVHCGLVNAALGNGLSALGAQTDDAGRRAVFLTGDTMNELMADYHAESYGGAAHYALPRVAPGRLRQSLVEGLDSGDREIGIFSHYGFDALQPYALCAPVYAALPAEILEADQFKQKLAREIMGDALPPHVYERPKVRAQMANEDGTGGTLAALVDRGIDSQTLAGRFADLLGGDLPDVRGLIRAGFYRMSASLPESRPRQVPPTPRREKNR